MKHVQGQTDQFAFLCSLADPNGPHYPFFEQEWLDFKGKPQDDKDAKKIWSKALSGYANITDGLIIWGIDARKTPPRDIDAACGLRLIQDPRAFESKLRDWIRDATNPPVMGLDYQPYVGPTGDGFVICFVPESAHKPHRAEFADKHYYYRAGDDFLMAEPGLLRTLFYPRLLPRVQVEARLTYRRLPAGRGQNLAEVRIGFSVKNTGNVTARDPYIVYELVSQSKPKDIIIGQSWDEDASPERRALTCRWPVHPGAKSLFLAITFDCEMVQKADDFGQIHDVPLFPGLKVLFEVYAENMGEEIFVCEVHPSDYQPGIDAVVKSFDGTNALVGRP